MPCKKGMQGCHALCRHRRLVDEYRAERDRQEVVRETATGGYATELAEYPPIVTFQQWLIGHHA